MHLSLRTTDLYFSFVVQFYSTKSYSYQREHPHSLTRATNEKECKLYVGRLWQGSIMTMIKPYVPDHLKNQWFCSLTMSAFAVWPDICLVIMFFCCTFECHVYGFFFWNNRVKNSTFEWCLALSYLTWEKEMCGRMWLFVVVTTGGRCRYEQLLGASRLPDI